RCAPGRRCVPQGAVAGQRDRGQRAQVAAPAQSVAGRRGAGTRNRGTCLADCTATLMSAMAAQRKRAAEGQGGAEPPAKRDFLDMSSLTEGELSGLLALAARFKAELKSGIEHPYLRGRTLAMIFQKPSLRTRISFETGMAQLGGHAIYLAP